MIQKAHVLGASDLARICGTDLKTVHNWVNEGLGPEKSFRTPGRHLRFPAADVVAWLVRTGCPVPEELRCYLPADAKLSADLAELAKIVGKMSHVERSDLLERARGVVSARTGVAA